jgi:hypothetical protein
MGRDIRDPHFFIVGDMLFVKAVTRLPKSIFDGANGIDSSVQMITVVSTTTDGSTFSPLTAISPVGESFWRIKQSAGVYYTASYTDAEAHVTLWSSTDGLAWTKIAMIYDAPTDAPGEAEIEVMPSGRMLILVRLDGSPNDTLATTGPLRTKVCWAMPPYATFDCSTEIDGQRLDGPMSFQWNGRMFVFARRHLQPTAKKRTSLFEITGNLEGGPIDARFIADIPSAGDTSYSGMAWLDDHRLVTSWYSSDLEDDYDWIRGMLSLSDIWVANVDLTLVPPQ